MQDRGVENQPTAHKHLQDIMWEGKLRLVFMGNSISAWLSQKQKLSRKVCV